MDPDDALPPAIRRSPAASFEQRKQSLYHTAPRPSSDDSDESPDEAAPPPISRSRSNSLDIQHVARTRPEQDPVLHAESLPNLPPTEPAPLVPPRHKFQYPNRSKPENLQALQTVSRTSRRSPRGLVSYRTNKKIPLHLRRQPSLETIASVTTTASEDHHDPPEAEAPSPDWFTQEDDPSTTPVPGSKASSAYAPSTSSQESHTADTTPLETPFEFGSLGRHSPQSLFRKMMPRKADHVSSSSPHRLTIEKSTSIDRTTTPSSTSQPAESFTNGSNISRPPAPASSDRSLASGLISVEQCQSGSSSEWSASSFDVGTLTEAQLKRCRKKGINPALYAEMRAARGKKWTSPIAGNTFL